MRGETGAPGTCAGRISSTFTGLAPDSVVSRRTISLASDAAVASAISAACCASTSVTRTLSRTVSVGFCAETWAASSGSGVEVELGR